MNFSFDIGKNEPLRDGVDEALSFNRRIAETLDATAKGGVTPSTPVILDLQVSGQHVHGALDGQKGDWQSAADLKKSNPEALRMLRYKYRDWRIAAQELLKKSDHLQEVGMDEVDLSQHLDCDNASLFAIPGEYDNLEWRCVLGFQFKNHALNHVSEMSGAYFPQQSENEPQPTMKMESSSNAENTMPPPGVSAPAARAWWQGHQHQIFLVFACGFLTASLFGALFFKLSPCDISQVRNQIDNMAVQIDQRCNFSQAQPR